MKSFLLSIAVGLACTAARAQSVAVNNDGSLAHASAALDIKSNNKGILIPRLTTAERTAIVSAAKGLLVFDTDVNAFWFFNGAAWTSLAGDNVFALPFAATATSAGDVFSITNNGIGAAVRTRINTQFGNPGAAAIYGESAGTGGTAGVFHVTNINSGGRALVAINEGNANALEAHAYKNGNGIETSVKGIGIGVYAYVPGSGTGRAGKFSIFNESNNNDVITVSTIGNGIGGNFKVDNLTGTSPAVKGEVNTQYSNFGAAGIWGVSSGTGGYGGVFHASNVDGSGTALLAVADGNGDAMRAYAHKNGNGVESTVDGTGYAFYGYVPDYATGRVAFFQNWNTANTNPVLTVETRSAGSIAVFKSGSPSLNVARISSTGKGFFNGGTQTSGADLAEAFDVTGDINSYGPGDVLVIATDKDRAVEKSTTPYSTLVAGVYATKPGVLLTEENIDSELLDKVPMGVVGVIPTRVCMEGGAIKRGDMLVTSSLPGVAMKADPDRVKPGQVIGKALQDHTTDSIGKIKVLVNVK